MLSTRPSHQLPAGVAQPAAKMRPATPTLAQVEHRIFEADELKPLLDAVNAETQKEKESEA